MKVDQTGPITNEEFEKVMKVLFPDPSESSLAVAVSGGADR
jgi:hypothetical protein